jgi:hypothetical protein
VGRLTRVSRVSLTDYLLSEIGLRPYRCDACLRRAMRPDYGRMISLALCLFVMVSLGVSNLRLRRRAYARPPASSRLVQSGRDILTNEDIAQMARVHMPAAVMQRLIDSHPNRFRIDSKSLIELKKDEVPDQIILAMVTMAQETSPKPASPSLAMAAARSDPRP